MAQSPNLMISRYVVCFDYTCFQVLEFYSKYGLSCCAHLAIRSAVR